MLMPFRCMTDAALMVVNYLGSTAELKFRHRLIHRRTKFYYEWCRTGPIKDVVFLFNSMQVSVV